MTYILLSVKIQFFDPENGHIITGDVLLIKNQKLRSLSLRVNIFWEPNTLNYSKCKKEIDRIIEEFAGSDRSKHKLEDAVKSLWIKNIKEKIKNKIKSLKS